MEEKQTRLTMTMLFVEWTEGRQEKVRSGVECQTG